MPAIRKVIAMQVMFTTMMLAILGTMCCWGAEVVRAQEPLEEVVAAIDRGLEYLYRIQESDGGWSSPGYGKNVAITSLATLAFLARGHVPGRGPYSECLERATQFLCSMSQPGGALYAPTPAPPMYQHGLGTLALAELYGMTRRRDVKEKLEAAVDLIVRCQNDQGGWRYQPQKADADLSVTVMQLVALKGAMNAGIKVPQATVEKGILYVRACAHPGGGFAYQPGGGPAIPVSAAGTISMQVCGAYEAPEVKRGLDYLAKAPLSYGGQFFFYAIYYTAQAMNQAGGAYYDDWMNSARSLILSKQQPDGGWPAGSSHEANAGTAYSTAMALLVLEVDCHYLPIYQR